MWRRCFRSTDVEREALQGVPDYRAAVRRTKRGEYCLLILLSTRGRAS